MTIDRRFNHFLLIKEPHDLSRPQAKFMYDLIVERGGKPGNARWLTFTEVVNAAEKAGYKKLLDPKRGNVEVPDSVYWWLNKWSREDFMQRN